MKRLELYRDNRTKRFKRKMREFARRTLRDTAYFILTGLIFYGLMVTTIIPAGEGIAQGIHERTLKITKIFIPSTQAEVSMKMLSPIANQLMIPPSPTPTPALIPQTPEQETMVQKIKKVFGSYTDKALLLLSCENASLNPNAVNTAGNTPEGSMDIGVFQINNYWNGIGNTALLKDPDVNIAVAWYKFKASGYSFNLWTCGRKLGI